MRERGALGEEKEGKGRNIKSEGKKEKADQVLNENMTLHHFHHCSAFQSSLSPVYTTVKW